MRKLQALCDFSNLTVWASLWAIIVAKSCLLYVCCDKEFLIVAQAIDFGADNCVSPLDHCSYEWDTRKENSSIHLSSHHYFHPFFEKDLVSNQVQKRTSTDISVSSV